MRTLSSILIFIASLFLSFFTVLQGDTFAAGCLFSYSDPTCGYAETPYCAGGSCTLQSGLDAAKNAITGSGIDTNQSISEYTVWLILRLLTFVSLIAVVYVIYAGFQIMTGAWDEEKNKKWKNIILYVILGIVIMWLAYAMVNWIVTSVQRNAYNPSPWYASSWSLVPTVSAAYTESEADTFREYQNKLRIAIQDLESELKINKSVNTANISSIKSLVQGAYDRLPDFGDAGTQNDTMKRAVDRDLDLASKNPSSSSAVGTAISSVASFISSAKIESVQGGINASPSEGNAPLITSFEASGIKDPSGATPDQMSYIWWMRENGGTRRELGRGKSLIYTFREEGSYTVFLDVISGSRNSKKKIDVLPLTTSKTIEVKSRLGEIVLLVNGVNVSNISSLKINPTIGKMGVILDATASRATGGSVTETKWEFGNNNTISYRGAPIVERQIFANEWDYSVKLTLITNNGQTFTKEIRLIVRNPAAVIQWEKTTGNVGDDMFFSALSYFTNTTNVEYSWQIQDDNNKKIVSSLPGNSLKYKFDKIGNYIITLTARSPNGDIDTDSRQITIESRAPMVNLESPKPANNETPNILIFDASKSYDPDTMGRKWLTYTWRIDGEKIELENIANDGARGTRAFDTIGPHTLALTVANAYGKVTTVERPFEVTSLLSANILISPRVAPLGTIVNFIAQSEHADFFEWNMGDGSPITTGNKKVVQHIYQKTGTYDVTLTVSSAKWGESNQIRRRVYVTDTNAPFAMINISNSSSTSYYDKDACGSGATVVNRSEATNFDGSKSINLDGGTADLTYTWTYFGKVKTTPSLSEKMNEIGCYPIKLTVRSNKNGATHTATEYISIKNQLPELTSISTSVDTNKKDSQKVLVRVNANGASDPDGVITSYIWYYTTESDREPQNVQITQKPEITFVLPNITEKYYFGVILEDNDGAKANSMTDADEQVPLILDNQNGNIYMPLIALTMPKSAVLVGENVHMSAEAKTIIGANITKNAEYAWDFDGDGKFDERSANPSVNHVFKNSGTYAMKVRVTYNGVSNTKYGTIYVKNPLKADASIYELADGSLYIMNTSEWLYDRTTWTIAGEQTESPYALTIPRVQLDSLSGSTTPGTLRVSHGEADTSTYTLSLENKITLTPWSGGVIYQSSPRSTDDIIHIKWQSDKLVLSLIGNTATTYKIDSDIRIDNDLDGVPDNDIDNKDHTSYTDGSAYIISDFADTRVRERTIRVSLISGGVVTASKDISVVFDFIAEGLTGSGEDLLLGASGAMSTFERAKLEELASMIRTTDGADRIVLMQEYNTMIENWSDSFSKAKSLIDIQEVIDTTALTADKKGAMTALIDTLLVGDAASTDEITLASKLIQDLIPEGSANRTSILEKLTLISSHPSDLTANKKLGNEILDLVKDDTTIEDKYKLHIRNQLRIIINGGQASTPSAEVEEASATGGGILAFISGVVWIFAYIIWGIIFVLLLGYIFYLLSRKNTDIGFQDFLIDSVFHTKKAETTTTGIRTPDGASIIVPQAPPVVVSPVIKVDPLASYTPPVIEVKPTIIEAPTIDPLASVEPASIPSWLQVPKTEEKETTLTEEPIPIAETQDVSTAIEIPIVPAIEVAESAVPSWLQVTDTPVIETPITTDEVHTDDILAPDEDIAPERVTATTPEPSSDALPDWLMASLQAPETTPVTEAIEDPTVEAKKPEKKKKPKKIETPKEAAPTSPTISGDIPDWLK